LNHAESPRANGFFSKLLDEKAPLFPSEAAEFLNTTTKALADWRELGGGPGYMRVGERVFYRTSALKAFQESQNQSK
jgi:hypothetical protein